MNKSPESDDAAFVRRLLVQEPIEDSPELLEGLRRLRSFRSDPAPEPTGDLAALLQGTVLPLPKRSRHRGVVLSFALAGAMAIGTTGVAASNDGRITCDSVVDAVPLPQGEPAVEPSADPAREQTEDTGTETGRPETGQVSPPSADAAPPTGAAGSAAATEPPGPGADPDTGANVAPATAGTLPPGAAAVQDGPAPEAGTAPAVHSGSGAIPGNAEDSQVPDPAPVPEPDAGSENPGPGRSIGPPGPQPSDPELFLHRGDGRGHAGAERADPDPDPDPGIGAGAGPGTGTADQR